MNGPERVCIRCDGSIPAGMKAWPVRDALTDRTGHLCNGCWHLCEASGELA